jgi:hypothetical protein
MAINAGFISDETDAARIRVRAPLGEKRIGRVLRENHHETADYANERDEYKLAPPA